MLLLRIWSVLLCACLALTARVRGSEIEDHGSLEFIPVVPEGERTHEERVNGTRDLVASARDSYDRMRESAQEEHIEAVEEIRLRYEERLSELAQLDYDAMTDREIMFHMEEVSGIITAIREVRDAIAGLS